MQQSSRRRRAALLLAAALAAPGTLRAQAGPGIQPFLFSTLPAPAGGAALASVDAGYAQQAFRALAPEALEMRLGLLAPLGRRLTLLSSAGLVPGGESAGVMLHGELMLGVLSGRPGALSVGLGGVREYDGTGVALARVAAVRAGAGWQLAGNVRVEHPFARDRDALDLLTSAGYTRRLHPALALGVEGVAEDLEGLVEREEAEGGAKLMLGPTLALGTERSRWLLLLGAGPVLYVNRNVRSTTAERDLRSSSGFVLRLSLRHR
jgi:hypothetical protein